MKFPFVSRSRYQRIVAELEKSKQQCAKARTSASRAKELAQVRAERLDRHKAFHDRERDRLQRGWDASAWAHSRVLEELRRARGTGTEKETSEGAGEALPVVLGIDIEPDRREVDREDPSWRGTEVLLERTSSLRSRLEEISGGKPVPFHWFLRVDPQVELANGRADWVFEQFADFWNEARRNGDEIGIHVHPWRWSEEKERWIADHGDSDWVAHCVRMGIETYREFFGEVPNCYRGGDRFLSDAVLAQLEEAGVRVDLTVERMPEVDRLVQSELGSGAIPGGLEIPDAAYWPSREDYRRPGPPREDGVGILPVTSYPGGSLIPWMAARDFQNALEWILADPGDRTHLAFFARSDVSISTDWEDYRANLEALARQVREGRLEFTTGSDAWDRCRESLARN